MTADPRLDGFTLMARDASRATGAVATIERFYAVGPHTACFRFAGPALVEPLTRAIQHLATAPVVDPELVVTVWDSQSTGVEMSPLLESIIDRTYRAPFEMLSPRQEIKDLSNDLVAATIELGSGVVTLLDRTSNEVVYWVRDPPNLPYYEQGAPFRTVFNWWLSQHGMHCIHAAAVGTTDGALLLTGKGGSGKSTTALACVNSPLHYVSDDYCVFSAGPNPEVFSLYNTAKLRDDEDLARQPHFEPWVVNPDHEGDQKYLMFLAEQVPDQILMRAPVKAIVLPRVQRDGPTRVRPASSAAALRALAPTSMFQLPGAADNAFFDMAALARSVPSFELDCGPELDAFPELLMALLTDPSSVVDRDGRGD